MNRLKILIFLIVCSTLQASGEEAIRESAQDEQRYLITQARIEGAERTSKAWVLKYLALQLPANLGDVDFQRIKSKLLTTDVFQSIHVSIKALTETIAQTDSDRPHLQGTPYELIITIDERWTIIPVVRGMAGGGTPLTVLGVYDTHSLGSLWTLGAEGRKYGDAPWGHIVWARAPRWQRGKHYLSLEWWQLNRQRYLFRDLTQDYGRIDSQSENVRITFLLPYKDSQNLLELPNHFQLGLDLQFQSMRGLQVQQFAGEIEKQHQHIFDMDQEVSELWLSPTLLYDSIEIEDLRHRGTKFQLQVGGIYSSLGQTHLRSEIEAYHFHEFHPDLMLALHGMWSMNRSSSFMSQFFLGGLESIRGLPDGALFGNYACYLNFEPRWIVSKQKYATWQLASFIDSGAASTHAGDLWKHSVVTGGFGFRASIPQVYRLILRVDYAWNLMDPSVQSFNIGLNQLFQPHRPL